MTKSASTFGERPPAGTEVCPPEAASNPRLLIIDDTPAIHDDFRKILAGTNTAALDESAAALFGSPAPQRQARFQIDSAYQGEEGLRLVQAAQAEGRPYALAVVDVRIPQGWDGIQTIAKLWEADPQLQVILCTAYSDYSWERISELLGQTDQLVILKKPFDGVEVLQLAHALTKKWFLAHRVQRRLDTLDSLVDQQTRDLRAANDKLIEEIAERDRAEQRLLAFSAMGQRLNAAKTAKEAAWIIIEVADQLIGWDACSCSLYSQQDDHLVHLLNMDLIEGRRTECASAAPIERPSAMARQAIAQGGILVLRDGQEPTLETSPFGDRNRRSASILYTPIRNGSTVIGLLSTQSYQLKAYDARNLETLRALSDYCGGALDRIWAQETLQRRLAAESLISALSSRFINLSDSNEGTVMNQAVEALAIFLGAAQAGVFSLSPDGATVDNTHQWYAPGLALQPRQVRVSLRPYAWWRERLARFELIRVPDVADLPPEARPEQRFLKALRLKSALLIPLVYQQGLLGVLAFGSPQPGAFLEADHPLLRMAGEIFANALQHMRAQNRILGLNRLYSVLSKINELIVRTPALETLCRQACRISVEEGHFGTAYISLLDPDGLTIRPIVFWGIDARNTSQLRFSADASLPEGRGPTGTAVREERSVVIGDVTREPTLAPWSTQIAKAGFRSIAAFPLKIGGRTRGALSLACPEPYFFKDEEIRLLEQLAADLAFALEFLDQEERLHLEEAALEAAATGIAITDAEGLLRWHNPAFARLAGYGDTELLGEDTRVLDVETEDGTPPAALWQTIKSGQVWRGETLSQRKDGSHYTAEMTVTPVRTQAGSITHYVAIKQDVSDRKRAEARLAAFSALGQRLSAAKTIKEAARITVDVADQLLGWDASHCDLYRAADDHIIHVLDIDLIDGQRTECSPAQGPQPPSAVMKRTVTTGGQLILRDHAAASAPDTRPFGDPTRPAASLLFAPIHHGPSVIGVLSIQSYTPHAYDERSLETLQALADHCGGAFDRLNTEAALLTAQEQLRQAQKMEAIGQLAGGVAHDFNNLLGVIRGNTELLLITHPDLPPDARDSLKEIDGATQRAGNLTRQLLTFSRRQVMQPRTVDLNEVVANLTKMLKRIIGENIELQCNYSARPPLTHADIGMLEQVLTNLIVNARDAMPQGGHLLITTGTVHIDEAYLRTESEGRLGDFVFLSITDTGTGIPTEHLPHLFEPFFTTKDPGKGTGLGLPTVYGIVKQHEGWVEVASKVGVGSTFRILLPATQLSVTPPRANTDKPPLPGGRERILLVEDDAALRTFTRRLLERFGYRVAEAVSGRAALEEWKDKTAEIDLLLSDIIMPEGLTGRALAERLRQVRPRLKVLFMSGYSGDVLGDQSGLVPPSKDRVLRKPCPAHDLLIAVRETLDGVVKQP